MKHCLRYLPASVKKVSLCSDTAGYQEESPLYRGEGKDPRLRVIDFAIGADVTEAFRAVVLATPESEWQPLIRTVDGQSLQTIKIMPRPAMCQPGLGTAEAGGLLFSDVLLNHCVN